MAGLLDLTVSGLFTSLIVPCALPAAVLADGGRGSGRLIILPVVLIDEVEAEDDDLDKIDDGGALIFGDWLLSELPREGGCDEGPADTDPAGMDGRGRRDGLVNAAGASNCPCSMVGDGIVFRRGCGECTRGSGSVTATDRDDCAAAKSTGDVARSLATASWNCGRGLTGLPGEPGGTIGESAGDVREYRAAGEELCGAIADCESELECPGRHEVFIAVGC